MELLDLSRIAGIGVCALVMATSGPSVAGPKPGSCWSIKSSSICMGYTGSYWKGKEKEMRHNCTGSNSKTGPQSQFLSERCPVDDEQPWGAFRIGTCIHGMEKPYETMAHYYTLGGGGFDDPDFDFDWLRISCQNTGNIWSWGPASGK